jgi:hypothetical protein
MVVYIAKGPHIRVVCRHDYLSTPHETMLLAYRLLERLVEQMDRVAVFKVMLGMEIITETLRPGLYRRRSIHR